jgi:acetyl-CoA carboxylase biotin carboxyl carrier protein
MDEQRQPASEENEATTGAATPVDWSTHIEFLRGLTDIVQQENLSEVIVESSGLRLTVKASLAVPAPAPTAYYAAPAMALGDDEIHEEINVPTPTAPAVDNKDLAPIVAPMVGVFYRSQSPDDPPFVEIGDHVEAGQTIGLVEAMKTFNEIASEAEGTIVEITAKNGDLIETGGTLMVLRKS